MPAADSILDALKRTPGNILGGGADLANLALGVIAGKGIGGLVDKPVGGSSWINEKFGLAEGNAVQTAVETALSMVSPGALAKGAIVGGTAALAMANMAGGAKAGAKLAKGLGASQRGVIAPASGLLDFKDFNKAKKLIDAGKEAEAYTAYKVYRDPVTQELLKVIPDTGASLKTDAFKTAVSSLSLRPEAPRPLSIYKSATNAPTTLTETIRHPELFAAVPELSNVPVSGGLKFANKSIYPSVGNAVYTEFLPGKGVPGAMALGQEVGGVNPFERMLSKILHETQHGIQGIYDMPRGGMPDEFLFDAARVQEAIANLQTLRAGGKHATGYATDVLNKVLADAQKNYESLPGEVQARLVQHQFENRDYTTNPLDIMKAMGIIPEAMIEASKRLPVDLTPDVQRILDVYAPKQIKGQTP
jgi:hypothetical protein